MSKQRISLLVLVIATVGLASCGQVTDNVSGVQATPVTDVRGEPGLQEFSQEIHVEGFVPKIIASQVTKISVSVKNTGKAPWPASGFDPVHLSYHWLDKYGKKVIHDGERTSLVEDLAGGATAKLSATVKAPSDPGDYILQLTMVQENVAWYNDRGAGALEVPVKVEK